MATNIKYQPGDTMTWTNSTGTDVVSGQVVVVGTILAVALVDIANGASGTVLYKNAVATCPKVSGAVIGQGETLTWDVSANSGAGAFDDSAASPATGDVTGNVIAHAAAGNGDTTVEVVLNGVPGTVA